METKFMAGPWFFKKWKQSLYLGSVEDASGNEIAALRYKGEERIANARLIETAPELFEALDVLVKLVEEIPDVYEFDDDDKLGEAMYQAGNVLFKAAGVKEDKTDEF